MKLESFRFRRAGDHTSELALLDFGLCCPAEPQASRDVVGTMLYTAPEVFSGDYSTKVDAWSAGVMLFVMLTGQFPVNDATVGPAGEYQYTDAWHARHRLPRLALDLVERLLALDPKERLTAAAALGHGWFADRGAVLGTRWADFPSVPKTAYLSARALSKASLRAQPSEAGRCRPLPVAAGRAPPLPGLALHMQMSDLARAAPAALPRGGAVRACAPVGDGRPCRVVFLDVDGVLAPCVNTGQIVRQCVEGVVALCRLTGARIVLTSSWRLLDGKVEMLEDLLQRHHGMGPGAVYDVTPDVCDLPCPAPSAAAAACTPAPDTATATGSASVPPATAPVAASASASTVATASDTAPVTASAAASATGCASAPASAPSAPTVASASTTDPPPHCPAAAAASAPASVAGAAGPSDLPAQHFVRVNEREGLSLATATAALVALGASDESARATLAATFTDPDFDLEVFSELTREYSRVRFSPRSRGAADWIHEPCSAGFAKGRCREVLLWLERAAAAGVEVTHWVVLDDDDLLQTGLRNPCPSHVAMHRSVKSQAAPNQPLGPSAALAVANDDDDVWAFAF